MKILERFEKEFFNEGYMDTYSSMVHFSEGANEDETFPIVLCHNDVQENNILINQKTTVS